MMMMVSMALAGLLGLLLVAKIALLVWGIRRNQRTAEQQQRRIRERLEALPLATMLDTHQVGVSRFLHQQRAVEIERQLRICADCEETPRCRALLKSASDWTFCPLEAVMARLRMLPA